MDGACLQELDISIVPTPSQPAAPVLHNLIQIWGGTRATQWFCSITFYDQNQSQKGHKMVSSETTKDLQLF